MMMTTVNSGWPVNPQTQPFGVWTGRSTVSIDDYVTKGRLRGGAAAGDGVANVVEAGLSHSRRRRFI